MDILRDERVSDFFTYVCYLFFDGEFYSSEVFAEESEALAYGEEWSSQDLA